MRGLIERWPNEGLRIERQIYDDADFDDLGIKLKDGAVPRSWYNYGTRPALISVDIFSTALDRMMRLQA